MQELLPPGVGRIPQWWMEITPHYVLDLEEEEFRRKAEEQMAIYYKQMADASDGNGGMRGEIQLVDADGNPIPLGLDGKPWNNGWKGRSSNGGAGGGGQDGPLGRHFVPGQVTPEVLRLLGISDENDPEYRSYLTGAKYPPGYWEKLAELGYSASTGFSANNLAQTDFGRYGRQAEQPKHKPSWTKMKLRSTTHGRDVRQGVYDSPKREPARRVTEVTELPRASLAAPMLDGEQGARPTPASQPPRVPAPRTASAAPKPVHPSQPTGSTAPPSPGKKKVIRKVRKVRRKKDDGGDEASPLGGGATAPSTTRAPEAPVSTPTTQQRPAEPSQESHSGGTAASSVRRYNHKDYYYNAPADQAYAGTSQQSRVPAPSPSACVVSSSVHQQSQPADSPPSPPQPKLMAPPSTLSTLARPSTVIASAAYAPPVSPYRDDNTYHDEEEVVEEEEEEEEIIEEEIIEEEEEYVDEDEAYDEEYEEVIEDDDDEDDIEDLQAILAAKQAELARLKAQLSQG